MSMEPEDLDDYVPETKEQKNAKKRLNTHLRFARKNLHHKQKMQSKKKIKEQNKKIKEQSIEENKKTVEVLRTVEALAEDKTTFVTTDVKQLIETDFAPILETKKVGWEPFPGPQTDFLQADEFEVLFSGGRAPGKSDALLIDGLRWCYHKDFRGLMIRKAMPDLRDLIRRAKEIYPLAYPGTKWKEQEKLFVFPSGATIEFGYCDHEDDVARYQGQEYTWLGVDELTQITTEEIYEKLILTVRKSGEGLKNYVRATTNPSGPGKAWVKRRFVDLGPQNKTLTKVTTIPGLGDIKTTRKWIHGTVFDNPKIVRENPQYIAMLQNIDNAILRAQWLEGDWDSAEGLAFDEFDRKVHVIEPFQIPDGWYRFCAADWGYKTKAACLWMAVDYDSNVYVYRELITTKVLAKDFGDLIRNIELQAKERIRYRVLDISAWSQRGENSPPPAEDMGLTWRPSDRGPHSRKTGKMQVHNYLQIDPVTNTSKLKIFNTCTDVISGLSSLPMDKNDNEDVDTKCDDHSYDALRYGLSSRPRTNNNYAFANEQAEQPTIIDHTFGF